MSRRLRRTVLTCVAVLASMTAGLAPATAVPPEVPKQLIAQDFPDPDLVRVGSTWYAYATNNFAHVPVASAPTIDGPWTVRGDAMPGGPSPSWATAGRTWAPDVHLNGDGTLTMTYTAWHTASGRQCIGVATATNALGPFTPAGSPLICPLGQGGAIDANTFVAADGTRYLLWKNDGNAIGQPSTLWLVRTTNNGTALVGGSTALLTSSGVIEAPDIVQRGGQFVLFYSGGSYGGCGYETRYATANSAGGPYSVAGQALMTQGNTGICGPGGADVVTAADGLTGGDKVVFHGWVGGARHLYSVDLSWVGNVPVQGGRRAVSLDGDGRSELAVVEAGGAVRAWHNDLGFATMPYGDSAIIGTGVTDPARVRFADLDDDGRAEQIHLQPNGDVQAWHNDVGFGTMPYGDSVIIATGFTDPTRVRFADLDDDGRAELINIQADGQVQAWHNDGAFSAMPYGASRIIATGFTASRTAFADIDGDGRDEIIAVQANGDVQAWHNDAGFATMPYGNSVIIADGFTDPARVRFPDLDGDGRAEIAAIQTDGQIRAWHNDAGFVTRPYGDSLVVGAGFTDPGRAIFI
ncbi:family 43 glycosylhydrolase [Jiangella alba]|uniref:Repeat domain-containing protein n=1 Tax=Jiangella alba TaxID=561176 RepID=A0A1H5Q030_9ACTN|nr:family 43 glycosylhydrolase [Jiangella alba]SEF18798.1 Repeat domain-containing protein [Jiangella alba]